ncbi:MAG: transcriptional repressor [Oscillospiraceae bacterium]|nr:transcriptional repressor [Oscillospiraceae bacterium]
MNRPKQYNTKQSEAILDYLASVPSETVTVNRIAEHFAAAGVSVSTATIYRHLDRLVETGRARKYVLNGESGASYQYAADACQARIHLKCEACGELVQVECDFPGELEQHVAADHGFRVETGKIVLYGKCESCTTDA